MMAIGCLSLNLHINCQTQGGVMSEKNDKPLRFIRVPKTGSDEEFLGMV